MRESFDFMENPYQKNSYMVIQHNHWGERDLDHTMYGRVVARYIPKKFVQRYIDKLVQLGYTLHTEWGFTSLESKGVTL